MASKQTVKLFDLKKKFISSALKLHDLLLYGLLRRKKEALIIGNASDPVINRILKTLSSRCNITLIDDQSLSQQLGNEKISHILLKGNYRQVEEALKGKQINAIIVSPHTTHQEQFNFEDEKSICNFPSLHYQLLMRNVLAYRLAYKYLTKTGVMILSSHEKDFITFKSAKKMETEAGQMHGTFGERTHTHISLLHRLLSSQVSYLNVVVGDREFTHFDSKNVVGLTGQFWTSDKTTQMIAERYCDWALGKSLPKPGSFALFKPPFEKAKDSYVEYL